jgi:hypothetical protein
VNASTQLLDNDDVRREVSVRLVNALYENADVGTAIDEQLPEQLQGLGGPLAGVLRDPLIDTADTLLDSPPVRAIWKDANRAAHGAVLAILEDDVGDNISTSDGKVVIDLGGVLVQAANRSGSRRTCSTRSPTRPASSQSSSPTSSSRPKAPSR